MSKYWNSFLLFVQFFTRIPINKNLACEKDDFRRGAIFFPVIGVIIGGAQWIIYYFLNKVLPSNVTSVFLVTTFIIMTGALHLDGLGDMCDGFFAFKGGKEKIIEIMKDSRVGTYSVAAIILDILIRYSAYDAVIKNEISFIIIAAPMISRFMTVILAYISRPAKNNGSGNIFIGNIGKKQILISGLITFGAGYFLIGLKLIIILICSAVVFTLINNEFCKKKIGGQTGDTLGANNELVEMLMLTIYLALF